MSLHRRLERLESQSASSAVRGHASHSFEGYFRAVENYRRELDGLEPLPDLEYTEEDYHDAMNAIAAYRSAQGWQTGQARAFLDQWEQDINHKLYERSETKGT